MNGIDYNVNNNLKIFLGLNLAKNSQYKEETGFYKFTFLCLDKLRECKQDLQKKKIFLIKNVQE
jgi:hypothetical protein